jgi:hypothetical protein
LQWLHPILSKSNDALRLAVHLQQHVDTLPDILQGKEHKAALAVFSCPPSPVLTKQPKESKRRFRANKKNVFLKKRNKRKKLFF